MVDKLHDGGKRQTFTTGAKREPNENRGRWDLIPLEPMYRLAKHYESGAKKYDERNWEKGLPLITYLNSMARHLFKLTNGSNEEDHAAAIAWNAFGFMHTLDGIEKGKYPRELLKGIHPDHMPKESKEKSFFQNCIMCKGKGFITEIPGGEKLCPMCMPKGDPAIFCLACGTRIELTQRKIQAAESGRFVHWPGECPKTCEACRRLIIETDNLHEYGTGLYVHKSCFICNYCNKRIKDKTWQTDPECPTHFYHEGCYQRSLNQQVKRAEDYYCEEKE